MTSRIRLATPGPQDEAEFLVAVHRSRRLHHPWVNPATTAWQFQQYLTRISAPDHCAWLLRLKASDELVGLVNLSQIVQGCFRSAYLGYFVFAGFERQGLMREGMQAVTRDAFQRLKLHRLEANVQPGNLASLALLRSCGFQQEGYSPRYLKIGGRWRDHERWALLADTGR